MAGVSRKTFHALVEIIRSAFSARHSGRGRHPNLCVEDMVLASLKHWRGVAYGVVGPAFGLHKCNMCRVVKWVERSLESADVLRVNETRTRFSQLTEYERSLLNADESLGA
jgi:hypothetical protein